MKCFKNLKKECIPRKCNEVCYIKDKHKGVLNVFNSNTPDKRQKEVNNYFIDSVIETCKKALSDAHDKTYEHYKQYPNHEVYRAIQEMIEDVNQL